MTIFLSLLLLLVILYVQIRHLTSSYFGTLGPYFVTKQVTMTRGNHKVILLGMIHIAAQYFYDGIEIDFEDVDYLHIQEGVKTGKKRRKKPCYHNFAKSLGLTTQPRDLLDKNTVHGDVNANDMSEDFQKLNKMAFDVFEIMFENTTKPFTKTEFKKLEDTAELFKNSRNELDDDRNDTLFKVFLEQNHETVIIPWGCNHLNDIEERLTSAGYVNTNTIFRTAGNMFLIAIPFALSILRMAYRARKIKRKKK